MNIVFLENGRVEKKIRGQTENVNRRGEKEEEKGRERQGRKINRERKNVRDKVEMVEIKKKSREGARN